MTGEVWTIGDVARLSGVTTRTLRHYDAIGLLSPAGTAAGGRRVYGRSELVRLQQILLLRDMGVDLASIDEALADGVRVEHMRAHLARLNAERERLARLAETVARTIASLEKGEDMAAKDLYEGFDHSRYEEEARRRWGDRAVDRGNAAWAGLGDEGRAGFLREAQEIGEGLAAAMAAGRPADDDGVQDLVARHHAWCSVFWTPDARSFAALGQGYVDDPRFTATYDAIAPGLAVYLRDAMAIYARERLA